MADDLVKQLHRIITTLPHDAQRDADVSVLFRHCVLTIIGGRHWPDRSDIEVMRSLRNGYGCWLDDCERAIVEAPRLPRRHRQTWLTAFNGAKALVHALHLPPIPTEREREAMRKAKTEDFSCISCDGVGFYGVAGVPKPIVCGRCMGTGLDPEPDTARCINAVALMKASDGFDTEAECACVAPYNDDLPF